jgi:hypothetical protein
MVDLLWDPQRRGPQRRDPQRVRRRDPQRSAVPDPFPTAESDGLRFRPSEAAEAALATVALGTERTEATTRKLPHRAAVRASPAELLAVLRTTGADLLFRRASAELVAAAPGGRHPGLLLSFEALEAHLARDAGPLPHRRRAPS